jgi:hypothetical protein
MRSLGIVKHAISLATLPFISAILSLKVNISGGGSDLSVSASDVQPPPQELSLAGHGVELNGTVTIVTGSTKDEPTLNLVESIVASAGGTTIVSSELSGSGTQILIGTANENPGAAEAAETLAGKSAIGLVEEGYVLATGKIDDLPTVVLNGVDTRGAYYAAQTLRQLVGDGKTVPGVKARDWPLMPVRGSIEGFYGIPWSHESRLDQFPLYAKHKLNTYVYTPKDDELLRREWRDLYEGAELEKLQELVDAANNNHVDFTFALSPGNDLCYSSDDDYNATVAKFEQIRDLGVRRFYIALDDIPTDTFHCQADGEKWPKDGDLEWLAEAQTFYLNRVQQGWITENDLDALETVPTSYSGSDSTPYKKLFGTALDKAIRIQWTGEGVFSPNVTLDSVVRAGESYVTENLFFWDNFPVNDGDFSRLFLNPLTERDPELYKHLLGFTSNPMQQPYASMIAFINYGDYTWNGPAYDATVSTGNALHELAGTDEDVHKALVAFVDLNQNWPYREPQIFAPMLSHDIADFWTSRRSQDGSDRQPLVERLQLITEIPERLSGMDMDGFASDVAPWSTAAMQWAKACQHLITMLDELDDGNKSKADEEFGRAQEWIEKTKEKTVETLDREGNPDSYAPNVGDGAFQAFVGNATAIYEDY